MATGFASIQRNAVNKDPGYKTLFERVSAATKGEKKSLSWYRSAVKAEASRYKKNFSKYIKDEKKDSAGATKEQDLNQLRKYTVAGKLFMFEYKAKMRWLPYYDRFPLVYVLKSNRNEFWGVNLHYLSPKKRILATKKLLQGRVDFPKACFHKYLHAHVNDGLYIDLASVEWDTAILIPTEDFVKDLNGIVFPVDKQLVWEDVDETYYDKIKGQRSLKASKETIK